MASGDATLEQTVTIAKTGVTAGTTTFSPTLQTGDATSPYPVSYTVPSGTDRLLVVTITSAVGAAYKNP